MSRPDGETVDGDTGQPAAPAPPSRRKKDFSLVLASNLGVMGLTFLTGTLNAHLLGPSGRGELSAIQNVSTTLGALALLGLPTAVGFFSSRRPQEARSIVLTALALCLVGSLPFVALAYAFMPALLHSQPSPLVGDARTFLLFLFVQPAIIVTFSSLQGMGKFRIWSLLRVLPNVASALAILLAWLSGAVTASTISKCYLLLLVFIIPVGFVALWFNSQGRGRFGRSLVSPLVKYGLPSAIMIPAGLINLQLDQLVMAAWFPSRLLGLYAVSVSWSSLISPVFSALGSTLFPALASADDTILRRAMVARSLRLAIVLSTILGASLALVTPFLVPFFFGRGFAPAVPTALILIAASVSLNLTGLCGEVLRGLGQPRWPLYGQLAAVPVTVATMALLLPRLSMAGAAIASLLAYSTAFFVNIVGVRRCCALSTRELLVPRRADLEQLARHLKSMTGGRLFRAT